MDSVGTKSELKVKLEEGESAMLRERNGQEMAEDDFLSTALGKTEDLIPPSPEWPEYENTSADELLDAARFFDCVNLPSLGDLHCNLSNPCSSSLGSSTSSSSASVSSPSSSSWIPTNINNEEIHWKNERDLIQERNKNNNSSSCAAAPSTPSLDHDSATSVSYHNSAVPSMPQKDINNNGNASFFPDPDQKIDVLEELQNLDLLDASDAWDPFTACLDSMVSENGKYMEGGGAHDMSADELPMVFFEWLKSNKDTISPEDLRNIKLKRSTIEAAAKQLGGGKKAMLHLLKLILAWVQNHHLQRKRKILQPHQQNQLFHSNNYYNTQSYFIDPYPIGHEQVSLNNIFSPDTSIIPTFNPPHPTLSSMDAIHHPAKYRRVPMDEGGCGFPNPTPILQPMDSWPNQQFTVPYSNHNQHQQYLQASFSNRLAANSSPLDYINYRSGSAPPPAISTKEARKNRMARQRRSMVHHHHHHSRHWSSSTSSLPSQPAEPLNLTIMQYQQQQQQQQQRQNFVQTDRRQGWKPEKNLKFLLQKVLKQSDVGNLGRIVLPKKEAETHLPELDARDGISIVMEDIVTSRVWNMRYRFWPNNKSRMYLLENTGDFVRSNSLQEGDFIVIYSDTKTGKFMIRGVKVPRTDTSVNANRATKCTSGSSSAPASDVKDPKIFKMSKHYGSHKVAVSFPADSLADTSSSVSDATVHSDPFLTDMVNSTFSTQGNTATIDANATANSTVLEYPNNDHGPNLERFPSLESGDLTLEEILDLVDTPDLDNEPSPKNPEHDIVETKG